MFFINLFNIINSIDNTLNKNFQSYNNSSINNFINDLKKHIAINESIEKLKNIPSDTLFTLDRYEGDFAVCENRSTGEMIDIPRLKITPYAKDGDIIKLENNIYQIQNNIKL